jgi:Papain-like cysteine protease AvrRpt2
MSDEIGRMDARNEYRRKRMGQVAYDVEVIVQEQNPICWVASCAMVKGFGTKTSVGVGEFTGGFDPSNSCIANLAGNWSQCVDLMNNWGFAVSSVNELASGAMTADTLLASLQSFGPAVLLHMCSGFPYGPQWASQTFTASNAHAVVITGVDSDAATATFNNPWGDKDQSCDLVTLVQKINADQAVGKTIGFWRS